MFLELVESNSFKGRVISNCMVKNGLKAQSGCVINQNRKGQDHGALSHGLAPFSCSKALVVVLQ